jgi:hypothetical protein
MEYWSNGVMVNETRSHQKSDPLDGEDGCRDGGLQMEVTLDAVTEAGYVKKPECPARKSGGPT